MSFSRPALCFLWLLLLVALAAAPHRATATHIVGGEMTYRCLPNNYYEIRLDLYRDCIGGLDDAIAQDNPAFFGVFTGSGNRISVDSISLSSELIVPPNFNNDCVLNPPATCLNQATFKRTFYLPPSSTGYYIVYQRCCRNASVINIANPSNVGATYYCRIPPQENGLLCNNSAIFKEFPPQIICINNPLVYDHSAIDPDGDSLSYEFCPSIVGGEPNNPKPIPTSIDFPPVTYVTPYFTATKPMAGNPLVQINPTTGLITGTPNLQGRFAVSVCCHEWRSGILVNTVTREFQFVVTNCSKAVVANIPQYSSEFNTYIVQCEDQNVHFVNQSTGANENDPNAYHWDFGVPGTNADTSAEKEPTFTYPDTGTYTVQLFVNRYSTCPDSIARIVKVFPGFNTAFSTTGLLCPDNPIQFNDQTFTAYKPITSWTWSFGDGTPPATEQNPVHTYAEGGDYPVQLISTNVKGCVDTMDQTISIDRFRPFAGNDTIIVQGEYIDFQATGGVSYAWTPDEYLNAANIPNPRGFYPNLTRLDYSVFITSGAGCTGYDTINVWVVGQAALVVPSAFTPNGDGRNDMLVPIGIGFREVKYFRIFNRFGQMVFDGNNFSIGWDGTYNGQPADVGTYYWSLQLTDRYGKERNEKGDAALLR